jgi:hypothetical protein
MDGNTELINETDVVDAVRATCMLANVSIATWGGVKSDPALLDELKVRHNASGDVGKVLKNMLAGADGLLKQTTGACMAVRTRHYQLTLPLGGDPRAVRQSGPRLLPTMIVQRYINEMSALRNAAYAERDALCDAFPGIVTKGRANLGTMAPPLTAYPSVEELRNSFRVHFDFEPLPDTASFASMPLPQQTIEGLTRLLRKKQQLQREAASQEVWSRVREQIRNVVTNLEKPIADGKKARFKDATIENLRELLVLLPGWNVSGDPKLVEITADIENLLDGVDPKDLRKSDILRGDVAEQARKVSDKMSDWGF